MSTWITIKEQEDVEFNPELKGTHYPDLVLEHATIDVCYSQDDFGANYISIPVSFIIKVLRDNGYEIK